MITPITENTFIQHEKTKKFIEAIMALKESGEVKTYTKLASALNISCPTLSNILNRRANISPTIYKDFLKKYFNYEGDKPNMPTTGNFNSQNINLRDAKDSENEIIVYKNLVKDLTDSGKLLSDENSSLVFDINSIAEANRILTVKHEMLINHNHELKTYIKDLLNIVKLAYTK